MSLTKAKIAKKMSIDLSISNSDAMELTNIFFETLKMKCDHLKISKFGTFKKKLTVSRVGRNPKNKKTYVMPSYKKLYFKSSNSVKGAIN